MHDDIKRVVTGTLHSRTRLHMLADDGLFTATHLARFLHRIVPLASRSLDDIERYARAIPDDRLREQALASISGKAYHVAGAAIFATFLPDDAAKHYIELVAPLETLYDYLDNLCDRMPNVSPQAFRTLHAALADALDPAAPIRDYYADGPAGDDGDYLAWLVRRVKSALRRIGGHHALLPHLREAASFYADLQTYKHLPRGERERACIEWYERNRARFAHLEWFEFASACGSQFHVYAPLYALFAGQTYAIDATYAAYFPPVCALHVLFDYFIDHTEDRLHGELNFVDCYPSRGVMVERLGALAAQAASSFAHLPQPRVHRFVLRIMTLFYLTHPKVFAQGLDGTALRLLAAIREAFTAPRQAPSADDWRERPA